jgi:xylulokinase
MDIFLGFDLSTQSLSVVAINSSLEVIKEENVNFDSDLDFGTKGGVIHSEKDTVTSPVLMWVKAMDLLLAKLKMGNFEFSRVTSISVSGQQHGSVYWIKEASSILEKLNYKEELSFQLTNAFSVLQSPIWMDSSTSNICTEIEEKMTAEKITQITGSRCFERFTISQIIKIIRTNSEAFEKTERISLVSSFFASILCGFYAPIDPADGSGMNAMNLTLKRWDREILDFASPKIDLDPLLGPIQESYKPVGKISTYFQERYGFKSDTLIITGSGDNPCTLAGLKLDIGDISASLGTSDTLIGSMKNPIPSVIEGHIMCNCIDPDSYMGMICRKNGSLTREYIRNKFGNSDWDQFSKMLESVPAGNNGKIGFYFLETEIYPPIRGFHYFSQEDNIMYEENWTPEEHIRAVVESQFMLIALSCENIGFKITNKFLVTGGGAKNTSILKVLADVFGVSVYLSESYKSAAVGAAYRALHGKKCDQAGKFIPFSEIVGLISYGEHKIEPNMSNHQTYMTLKERYRKLLQQISSKSA